MKRLRSGIERLLAAATLLAAGTGPVDACGPWFPNRLLNEGDDAVLMPPVADFAVEIQSIQPSGGAGFAALLPGHGNKSRQTTYVDLAEVREALAGTGLAASEREAVFARYQDIREQIWDYLADLEKYRRRRKFSSMDSAESQPAEPQLDDFQIPGGLPGEFADYLRGAVAYHRKRYEDARAAWTALLDRPADQRRNRTVWAAYMLGRSWVDEKPDLAVSWFEKTRVMAREGFRDSTGLAAASFGWQARVELQRRRYAEAVSLYLEQIRTGDWGAWLSLRMTVERLLKDDVPTLEQMARHPLVQQVVTAYILARGGPQPEFPGRPSKEFVGKWLQAIEKADARNVPGAARLAWLAYQYDDMESARRWLDRAPQDQPIARWIRAKLLLYDGKLEPAAAILSRLVGLFPPDDADQSPSGVFTQHDEGWEDPSPRSQVWGEIGVLHVARHRYVEAMDALLQGGYWMDAAYVAERVLTVDELKRYVDGRYPPVPASAPSTEPAEGSHFGTPGREGPGGAMRYLLARRLAREKRWQEARGYYPDEWREVFDNYTKVCMAGHDRGRPKEHRAESLVEAAWIARRNGMELLGTELEPDWYTLEGTFKIEAASEVRAGPQKAEVVPSSADERKRLRQYTGPRKRWHYRDIAADLAWKAAELMPDESEETAKLLYEAGSWIKIRDPKAAERFYKALVKRCGSTPLGKQAAQLRWFPRIPVNQPTDTRPGEQGR